MHCLPIKGDFHNFSLIFLGQMHSLPQRLNQCCLKLFWMEGQCIFPFIFSVNETITVLWGGWHLQVHRVKKFIKSYQKMTSIVGVGFKINIWIFCIWFYHQMIRLHMIFNWAFLSNVFFFYKYFVPCKKFDFLYTI